MSMDTRRLDGRDIAFRIAAIEHITTAARELVEAGEVALAEQTLRSITPHIDDETRVIPASRETITYVRDTDLLDDVVLTNVDVHIERMGDRWYWAAFYRGQERMVMHFGAKAGSAYGRLVESGLSPEEPEEDPA